MIAFAIHSLQGCIMTPCHCVEFGVTDVSGIVSRRVVLAAHGTRVEILEDVV